MISFYPYILALFEWTIFSFSFAEIFTIILIGFCFYKINGFRLKLYNTPQVRILFIFWLWTLFSLGVFLHRDYFSLSSFINNFIRLTFYTVGFVVVPEYLKKFRRLELFIKNSQYVLIIISIMSIIEFLFYLKHIDIKWGIPGLSDFGNPDNMRIKAVFSEPAHLSIFIGTFLGTNMEFYRNEKFSKLFKITVVLSLFALIISMSLIGILVLITIVILLFFFRERTLNQKISAIILMILGVTIVLMIMMNSKIFQENIISRLENTANVEDSSGIQRVLGAYEYTYVSIKNSWFFGEGFGQLEAYFQTISDPLIFYWSGMKGGINNIFGSLIIQFGIIGFLLFIRFSSLVFKKSIIVFTLFILFCFSWGFYNTPLFWAFYYVPYSIMQNKYMII